jgi:hypothetical protein
MHDAKGRPLTVGDTVLIPATIKSVSAGEYCTLDVETAGVMPENGSKNSISALNTKQVYRANAEDLPLSSIDLEEREGKVYLA